ncbi:cell division protein FtsQ/DivIB [Aliiroseovarius sp. S2029]|uniref:cell division protein FtsQ/DivIB n=1 Tax=Aliiroseovarius sp. S2029 TaxID=2936988 RepID=UPI0020C119FA|nr:cell division protein FtsQ/DivIB [Aliiroseovarius sp. S2029]MCK8483898.1 cell division protein FtsQ/DivIB [Aliiroseovarius sp. S2029]
MRSLMRKPRPARGYHSVAAPRPPQAGGGASDAAPTHRDPAPSRLAYKAHRLWLTPTFRTLLRVGLPVGLVLLAVGLYFANPDNRTHLVDTYTQIQRSVQERPEFMVKLMAVEGATPVVADAVRDMLPIDFPISSFDLDLEAMRLELTKLDVVEKAALRVRPGGVLEVAITERQPVIIWRHDGILDLLDRSGHRVASLITRNGRSDLPLIAGAGANQAVDEALALIETARPLGPSLRGLVRVGERRWDVVLATKQRILLPEHDSVAALEQVIALDQAQEVMARDLTVVDMRNPLRPTLRLGEPAVEELRRIRTLEFGADDQ